MLTRVWLTLKQHRFETIAITVLCLGVAIAAIFEAFRLNSLNFPASCMHGGRVIMWYDPSAAPNACLLASQKFSDILNSMDVRLLLSSGHLLPFVVGIAFGAPLVAKEIEQGTAPLSWALAGSRRRWLVGKIVAAVVLIVPLLLIAGLALDVLQGASVPGTDPHASFENYSARGVFLVFWGLAALLGTVALGTLLGRTLPAVFLALVVCFLARGFWEPVLNRTILPQFVVMQSQDSQNNGYGYSPSDLYVYYRTYLDGKPWDGDVNAWWNEHQPPMDVDP
jgi:ABC-type transport system involved in multi-copper enzyme maturation permease subunit